MTHKDEAGATPTAPKKVVYGKKKPRGPAAHVAAPGSIAGSSAPSTPQTAAPKELEPEPEVVKAETPPPVAVDAEEPSWDASSDEGKDAKVEEDLKDDWDASSEDEEKKKKAAAKAVPKGEYVMPSSYSAAHDLP